MRPTEIYPARTIDYDDRTAEIAVPGTSVETSIIAFTAKLGMTPRITALRQAWDAAMDTFVTYTLYINGAAQKNYTALKVQLAAPEADTYLPLPVKLSQGDYVELKATSSVAGNFTARLITEYFELRGQSI